MYRIFWRKERIVNDKYDPFLNPNTLIEDKDYYQVRECEIPYEYVDSHLIIWDKEKKLYEDFQFSIKNRELYRLFKKYWEAWYTVVINPPKHKSVKTIAHYHLLKFDEVVSPAASWFRKVR